MTSLGTRFVVAALLGIAAVAALSVLASDAPDGFEASAAEAGHTPEAETSSGPEIPAIILVPAGLGLTGLLAIAATRFYRPTPQPPVPHET